MKLASKRIFQKVPLGVKMVIVTILVGIIVWAILDRVQTRQIRELFRAQLAEKLSQRALEDRVDFDRYVKMHFQSVKLYVSQKNFSNYIENTNWPAENNGHIKYYEKTPPWFPRLSVLRTFAQPRYALLLDSKGKVIEVYKSTPEAPPESLLHPSRLLLAKSKGQNFLTNLDNIHYLVTSMTYTDSDRKLRGTLMFASPIDDSFLISSIGHTTPGHIVALMTSAEDARILTSSNLEELPSGMSLRSIRDRYLVSGQGFFDYGSSEIIIKLASFISVREAELLTRSVISKERQLRAISAPLFILTFALLMFWITRRIQSLTSRVVDFTHLALGAEKKKLEKGDQIYILEEQFRDLTEEVLNGRDALKKEAEALEHLAMHDTLTLLPNRTLLHDRLEQAILTVERDERSAALLMMDIDQFKEINDTLGHHVGDMVLKEAGQRLSEVLRKSDTVARFGGDEFMILLPNADEDHSRKIAIKLMDALGPSFVVDGHSLYVGASIGIVLCPKHGTDANTLMQRADVAMYVSKHTRCGISCYDPKQDQYSRNRLVLMGELRDTIENGGLMLYYQPKVDYSSGCVTGVEALVRWDHPNTGIILPNEFISLAEYTGLIKPLNLWVLSTAIRQCAEWRRDGIELSVSVNLSTRNLQEEDLPIEVEALLERWGVPPQELKLEITETAMMIDPGHSLKILKELDEIGVRLSIDDFGTGYASLAYIKNLPVDELKIDRSFVMHMEDDRNDEAIIRSTIDLAHNLRLKVVAEGVECAVIMNMLKDMGCDEAQGYYISPGLPIDKFNDWLKKSQWGMKKMLNHSTKS